MGLSWWCVPVSIVLAGMTWVDAQRRNVGGAASWTAAAGLTWLSVVPYLIVRRRQRLHRRPAAGVGGGAKGGTIVKGTQEVAACGQASAVINAHPDALWALVTDITRTGEWSPENTGGVWLGEARAAVAGARFKATNHRGWARWTTTCEVVAAVPGEFAFVTGTRDKPETLWRYVFEPTAHGTRVTESFELLRPPGAAGRLLTRITTGVRDRQADLEENLRISLVNLKRLAEQ